MIGNDSIAPTAPRPYVNPGGLRQPVQRAPGRVDRLPKGQYTSVQGRPGGQYTSTQSFPGQSLPQDINPNAAAKPAPGAAAPAQPSPLDATFFQNVASNQFKVNNSVNQLQQAGGYAQTALQSALAKLAYQQPRDALKLEQGANRNGSLYSSVYGQNQGNLAYSYAGRQGGLTDDFARQQAARQSQIAALQGGVPLYNQGQYLAAVGRGSVAAQKNPATGESAGPLVKVAKAIARPSRNDNALLRRQ